LGWPLPVRHVAFLGQNWHDQDDNSNCDWVVDLSFSTSTHCACWAPWTSLDLGGVGEARILILIVVHHRPTVVAPVPEALRRVAGFTGNYPHLFNPGVAFFAHLTPVDRNTINKVAGLTCLKFTPLSSLQLDSAGAHEST